MSEKTLSCDVLVIGSGAGGMSTAITARKSGLDVIVVEKADVFGGTTAFSGGVLWIPGNHYGKKQNPDDSREAAIEYLKNEVGEYFDELAVKAFLDAGPEMVDFFERETSVKFVPTLYPDYHPTVVGGVDVGRSILAAPFDIRSLGKDIKRMRPPLKTITFIGMMFNSSNADLKHFFNATRSLTSFFYVLKRLVVHIKELLLYRRGVNVTSGNALASRLIKSALDLNIPIHTGTAAQKLLYEDGVVTGAVVLRDGSEVTIKARKGVVLACGGFSHDRTRITMAYPHMRAGGVHHSPVPTENTGDGIAMAEQLGVKVDAYYPNAAAWMPVSLVPHGNDAPGIFPHLLDRYKPGVIGINSQGQRFCNESESYHDVGMGIISTCREKNNAYMWLICDQVCLDKYGLGYVKPAPVPRFGLLKNGYLIKGNTLDEFAARLDVPLSNLRQTLDDFNKGAFRGEDPAFQRGMTSFNRFLGDPEHKPNPCVAPIVKGPYYAVKVYMGDLGTFDGINTTVEGEVLDTDGLRIPGLYAVGNDRRSIMGGNYPAAGITLGPIMTFGYITGRHIAACTEEGN